MVGDGWKTSIWNDPWVPGLPQCRVKNTIREEGEGVPQRVSELISSGRWNVKVLQRLFSSDECDAIQRIPLPKYILH